MKIELKIICRICGFGYPARGEAVSNDAGDEFFQIYLYPCPVCIKKAKEREREACRITMQETDICTDITYGSGVDHE